MAEEKSEPKLEKPNLTVSPEDTPSYVYPAQNFKDYQYDIDVIGEELYGDNMKQGALYAQQKAAEFQKLKDSIIPPQPKKEVVVLEDPQKQKVLDDFFKKLGEEEEDKPVEETIMYSPPKAEATMDSEPPYYSNNLSNQHLVYAEYVPDKVTRSEVYPKYTQKPNLKKEESSIDKHPSSRKIKIVIILCIVLMFIMLVIIMFWIFKTYFIDLFNRHNNKISS